MKRSDHTVARASAWISVLAVGLMGLAGGAQAQQDWRGSMPQEPSNSVSVRASLGFTASPETFLMSAEVPFPLSPVFSVGPLIQVGVADDRTIVAPTINGRFNISQSIPNDWASNRLQPFVQGGIGFAYIDQEVKRLNIKRSRDDVGFLLNFGFGVDYYLTERIAIGSNLFFNVLPVETTGENFFFSWQVAGARIHF